MKKKDKKIILDTKYYKNALSSNYGSEKLISSNLYQLFSYLNNNGIKSEKDNYAEGILLYPKVNKELNLKYNIHGHEIKVYTVDLNREWQEIHRRLGDIIS